MVQTKVKIEQRDNQLVQLDSLTENTETIVLDYIAIGYLAHLTVGSVCQPDEFKGE